MKKIQLTKILSLAIIAMIITSCASSGLFTSRKYTAGNYRSIKHKAPKNKAIESLEKEEPVYASSDNSLTIRDLKKTESLIIPTEITENNVTQKKEKAKINFVSPIKEIKEIKEQIKDYKNAKEIKKITQEKKQSKSAASSGGIDTTALVSLILSVLAIVCDVIGFLMVLATAEYVFLLLFAVGLALGITGLIMGTKGLKNHRENSGSTIDLVFSIIGTALGGIAIIASIYYAVWSALWIAIGA
jgi:uncharacterized membrane protein